MLPAAIVEEVKGFVAAANAHGAAAVYLVGGPALGDFSERQSNVDLVVVAEEPMGPDAIRRIRQAEGALARAGRPAAIWYSHWEEIAEGPMEGEGLATPMTRSLLREGALTLTGPDWPVVAFDTDTYRSWCRGRLEGLAAEAHGLMVMRKGVTAFVLEAARLAQGAVTGRVLSKSEGGHTAGRLVPEHFRRILEDASGYRQGAHTSMYWGPFERKYDARELVRHLAQAVTAKTG